MIKSTYIFARNATSAPSGAAAAAGSSSSAAASALAAPSASAALEPPSHKPAPLQYQMDYGFAAGMLDLLNTSAGKK